MANTGNTAADQGERAGPLPNPPPGVAITIEARRIYHRRMHHSRAEYFHPARSLAARAAGAVTELALDIHFGRGFSEREITGTETSFRFAEESVGKMSERRLEIDEAHALVDCQSFDLREHGRVRGVEEIAAVCIPGAENSYWRLELLHRPDLHRRGVRP